MDSNNNLEDSDNNNKNILEAQKIIVIIVSVYWCRQRFYTLGTIHKVRTLKFGGFQKLLPRLYAFKQYNDVIKTRHVGFCIDTFLPLERTYFMVGPLYLKVF